MRSKLQKNGLYALVALQFIVFTFIVLSYYAINWFGTEVRVKTMPLHARDWLYGDYIPLSYNINEISGQLWKGTASQWPRTGQVIYVVAAPDREGVLQAIAAYPKRPSSQNPEIVLKGKVTDHWNKQLQVQYGIERVFIPENMEQKPEQPLIARVKVASWGQAVVEALE